MQTIRNFLKEDVVRDTLDEDAITQRLVQTDQIASERARHLKGPTREDAEDYDEEEKARRVGQLYKEEEEYSLAQEIYKEAIAESNAAETYDKRTFNWLRKGIGLPRRNELWETAGRRLQSFFQDNSDDSDDDSGGQNVKRLTRGMARTTRMKKREERVYRENQELDALLDAVKDLEDQFGTFGKPTTTERTSGSTTPSRKRQSQRSSSKSSAKKRMKVRADEREVLLP